MSEHRHDRAHDTEHEHDHGHNHDNELHAHEHDAQGHEHEHEAEHVHKPERAHGHEPAAARPLRVQVGPTTLEEGFQQEGLTLSGMDCADCALQIERVVSRKPGVASAIVSFAASKINVCFDPKQTTLSDIEKQITRLGYGVSAEHGPVSKTRLRLGGMDCVDCADTVRKVVVLLPGVYRADINFNTATLDVEHDRSHAPLSRIIEAVEQSGYSVTPLGERTPARRFWLSRKSLLTIASGGLLIAGAIVALAGASELYSTLLFAAAIAVGGLYIARSAWYSMLARSLDMNFLMTAAALGAAAIGQWAEGATVVFLFSLGNALQSFTLDRTRLAIQELMDLAPLEATVLRHGKEERLPVDDVLVGDLIIVRPGERVPVDGRVTKGTSSVSEAAITGESVPADKKTGDRVFAGSHNEDGVLHVRSTEQPQNTTIARIIRLVEEAQSSKAPSQQLIDRFSHYYTPAVVGTAIAVAILPPLLFAAPFEVWLYRALALLIIACPCALVISTPVSLVSAIGAATRHGVLIKDGASLENLGRLSVVAFDKTGTLTKGRPELLDIVLLDGMSEADALTLAASVERNSPHPLAAAFVRRAAAKRLKLQRVRSFSMIPGRGVQAEVDGLTYLVGKPQLFSDLAAGERLPEKEISAAEQAGETVVLLGTESDIHAMFTFADKPRDRARSCIAELKRIGVGQSIMLTGDHRRAAERVAAELGLDQVRPELLPEDKVATIYDLQRRGHTVGVVGDGINDAPALAVSDVGIAMGAIGSDITLETADVALLSDDLSKVPYAISLSRSTLSVIRQNITFSIAVKALFLVLAPVGLITLWLAVLADMGVSLIVIANGMRLFRLREVRNGRRPPVPRHVAAGHAA